MSEEGNRDDGQDLLQYMNLRTNLLSNISLLRQELESLWIRDDKTKIEDEEFDKYFHNISYRRDEIISIASQALTSEDFARFKDLVENSLSLKYTKFYLGKLKNMEKEF